MTYSYMENMIGKEVVIYPGDTYQKRGIIEEITEAGVLFKITAAPEYVNYKKCNQYVVGTLHFISFSAKLTFREVDIDSQ